jgi:AraC-like DNA-binding protein
MSDRLSALLQRFELHARVLHRGPLCGTAGFEPVAGVGHLHLLRGGRLRVTDALGQRSLIVEPTVLFYPRGASHRLDGDLGDGVDLVCASINFGAGDENPLLLSLPDSLRVPLAELPGLNLAQQLLFDEAAAARCGHDAVVDRLSEVLVIQLLRHAIEHRLVDAGATAGLSDVRLARALNAVHAEPAHAWTLQSLAAQAGMSRARFAAHFARTVGVPPGDYLTGWRLALARKGLRKGLAVKQVAHDVGYASASALGRAFVQRFGCTPMQWLASAGAAAAAPTLPTAPTPAGSTAPILPAQRIDTSAVH